MPPRGQIHALCGFFNGGISQWLNRTLEATGATMTDLASTLSANLDRIVVDQTGLAGRFDIRLEWDRKATPGARIGPLDSRNVADPANPPSADDGPSLFMAVEDQLGLRLEPGKGSVQVLVIDHVERP